MHFFLLASLLWGTSFVAGKYAEDFASPEVVVLFRLLIAGCFVAHIALPAIKKLEHKLLSKILAISLLTYPVTFLLQFIGLEYTTATNAVTMLGFVPLLVLLTGHVFFNQKASSTQIALALVALVGVLLVMGKPNMSDDNFVGCAIVFASCFVVAVWVQWSKSLMAVVPKNSYTAITLFCGALLTIPCVALINNDWSIHTSVQGVSAVIYLGIGCNLMASWFWNKGIALSSANAGGFFLALEPVFGVLFGLLLLGDRPSLYPAIGIGMVLFSVLYSVKLSKRSL